MGPFYFKPNKFNMNCLFCAKDSSASKSVEHIIPESLGNKKSVLPKGYVCDSCNQYFAIKIEKILLEQPYFKHVRNRMGIENKKRTIPKADIILTDSSMRNYARKVELLPSKDRILRINIPENDMNLESILLGGKLIIPLLDTPDANNLIVSRFLAKAAIESLAFKAIQDENSVLLEEVLNIAELEPLKQYARFGKHINYWPYNQRRIYREMSVFRNDKQELDEYQIINEWHFMYANKNAIYFILCILGIEYAINLGSPEVESYNQWLADNNGQSILDEEGRREIN